jgi:hypothetical protein
LLGLGPSAEIEVLLNPVEGRKLANWKNENNEYVKYNVFTVSENLTRRMARMLVGK